jgi:hypothetical protein
MGVERKDYIVLGANIKDYVNINDMWEDDKYLPYLEGHYNVEYRIIPSCYDDSYVIAGKVLGEYRDHQGISITNLHDLLPSSEDCSKVVEFLNQFDENLQPQILIFTHWY